MKKIQPVISEPRKREVLDGSRQQYRCTVEAARQLDGKQSRVQSCEELFQPDLVARRLRLAELCERLALSQPSLYGKKAEDILWRKGYYEVLSTAKNFKKNGSWTPAEKACVERHLLSGIGCYHLWVLRLQAEFQLDLRGMFDMPLPIGDGCLSSNSSTKSKDQVSKDWARQAVHHSLIALGDLIRYLADISPAWSQEQAARCYLQALNIEPMSGMPHNQLGMLSGTQNNNLDAVFHYMRCLCSAEKFAGAEGNLQRALQRSEAVLVRQPDSGRDAAPASPAERVRQCVARILNLAHIWFFDHSVDQEHGQACQVALMELEQCLSLQPSSGTEPCNGTEGLIALHKTCGLPYLDDSAVFKIVAVNLLCINQMQTKGSQLISAAVTFAMAMISQLSNHAVAKPSEPDKTNGHVNANNGTHSKEQSQQQKKKRDKKWNRAKMRRRGGDSSEESDQSQEESGSESSSECDSESDGLGSSSDEEEEEQEGAPVQQSKANNQPMPRQGILMGAKILFDWLQGDAEMLQSFVFTLKLLPHVIQFINKIAEDTASPEAGSESVLKVASLVPLPEDVAMRGVPILTKAQSTLDWEFLRHNRLHTREEMLLRSYKLVSFGHFLASANVGVSFDPAAGTFSVREVEQNVKSSVAQPSSNGTTKNGKGEANPGPVNNGATNESKRQLMHHMGRLWLRAEVRELERAVRKREGACTFSPYIVVDAEALLHHAALVKQLVFSRKFVVIIPCVVVSALDELKRDSVKARDATRWLETQFQRGNRFLRAQRAGERLSLPLIKLPKKKDKEAWTFFQVLECCAHLARQSSAGASTATLVTLLTGSDLAASRDFSPSGLAQSAGIKLESITSFCGKWKQGTSKSHGT